MTNLARLIQKDKDAFANIDTFVSMGGTFKSHGNCSPVAEYNYWCDPDAAALVYHTMHELGKTIHMVGLDVTRKNCPDTYSSGIYLPSGSRNWFIHTQDHKVLL